MQHPEGCSVGKCMVPVCLHGLFPLTFITVAMNKINTVIAHCKYHYRKFNLYLQGPPRQK